MSVRRNALIPAVLTAVLMSAPVWAAEIGPDGVPNFYKVDDTVYRGGQPLPQGWAGLAKLGVKTVIDLRHPGEHSCADEQRMVEAAGMKYVNVPMRGFAAPTSETITKALGVMNTGAPVFVHCKLGKERTGTIIAAYRIQHSWTNDKALAEAKGCGIHWYAGQMKDFIRSYRYAAPAMAQVVASADSTTAPATTGGEPSTVTAAPPVQAGPGGDER
jgi:protein tyrosine phosphatase (PTP) superfamily phosphohydrolase (DUF442 family)